MEREHQSASVPSCLPGALMEAQHAAPMPHHHGRAWRPHHPLHRAGHKEWWSGVRALLQPSVWPRHRRRQRAPPGPAPVLEATWAPWTPDGTASLCSSSCMPVPLIRVRTCGRRLRLPWVRCVFSPPPSPSLALESVCTLVSTFVACVVVVSVALCRELGDVIGFHRRVLRVPSCWQQRGATAGCCTGAHRSIGFPAHAACLCRAATLVAMAAAAAYHVPDMEG